MTITITAFERSPDGGKGLARDTRVRWALERSRPTLRGSPGFVPRDEGTRASGASSVRPDSDLRGRRSRAVRDRAIVFHIAERHAGLLPNDANARARAITWMFAALSTVEPPILELATARLLEGDKPWNEERLPLVEDRVRSRLTPLSARLGDADWLDGAFSAGDLMMVSVLLRLRSFGPAGRIPESGCLRRPRRSAAAYKRAFAAQLAINTGKPLHD